MQYSRRTFLARSTLVAASSTVAYRLAADDLSKNDRPTVALIGAGWQSDTKRRGRGIAIGQQATAFADLPVICELDSEAGEFAREQLTEGRAELVNDYRRVLDRPEIDAVLIATPDHWHAKIAIEAMRAGKDVYCEKPVATTIEEGKKIRETVHQTGRVFQVGTQQRSEYDSRFLKAIALVRDGRVGKLQRIHIGLGPGWEGGPFQTESAPASLDWERWLGPAPLTDYIKQRTHRTFRWWYEYAGGQICDWGAHHVDIAQWAIGQQDGGPREVGGTATWNQPLTETGMPTRSDSYNTPIDFSVTCQFPNDVEMVIDAGRNGITFEGDQGRFFVNRGTLEGVPVQALRQRPLPEDAITRLYNGKPPVSHMQNFMECLKTRATPISDIDSHHRILTTCHLANLSLRLNRTLKWDAKAERVSGDDVANALMDRSYRSGYEIEGV
ncbi:Gfo/Idh/MocA family protein [Roseiconus nitratireducens]|nr:Gfo/Idh/MocA family oxidoreductase [Roseiconus nitratireducens]